MHARLIDGLSGFLRAQSSPRVLCVGVNAIILVKLLQVMFTICNTVLGYVTLGYMQCFKNLRLPNQKKISSSQICVFIWNKKKCFVKLFWKKLSDWFFKTKKSCAILNCWWKKVQQQNTLSMQLFRRTISWKKFVLAIFIFLHLSALFCFFANNIFNVYC